MTRKHIIEPQRQRHCLVCGEHLWLSSYSRNTREVGYDALFCMLCDKWLESHCQDSNCDYCAERPSKPSEVPYPAQIEDNAPRQTVDDN